MGCRARGVAAETAVTQAALVARTGGADDILLVICAIRFFRTTNVLISLMPAEILFHEMDGVARNIGKLPTDGVGHFPAFLRLALTAFPIWSRPKAALGHPWFKIGSWSVQALCFGI